MEKALVDAMRLLGAGWRSVWARLARASHRHPDDGAAAGDGTQSRCLVEYQTNMIPGRGLCRSDRDLRARRRTDPDVRRERVRGGEAWKD